MNVDLYKYIYLFLSNLLGRFFERQGQIRTKVAGLFEERVNVCEREREREREREKKERERERERKRVRKN